MLVRPTIKQVVPQLVGPVPSGGLPWETGGGSAPTPLVSFSGATITRSSEGAYADPRQSWAFAASGASAWLAANLGRVFSDGAILVEGARTNMVPDSRDLANASWNTLLSQTVTAAYADGPDGATTTADRVVLLSAGYIGRNLAGDAGTFVCSYYGKAGPGYVVQGSYAGSGTVDGGLVSALTSAWQRFMVRHTGTAALDYWFPADGTDRSGVGGATAGARDLVHDLSQAEVGEFASSPIRSSGGTATRTAETVLASSASIGAALWSRGFVLDVWPIFSQARASATHYILYKDANNYLALISGTTLRLRANGSNFDIGSLAYAGLTAKLTVSVTWGGNMVLSGASSGTVALTQTWGSAANLYVGSDSTPANHLFGVVSPVRSL